MKTLYAGFVAIIGRPNVGKSTLLNHLIGRKIAITSRKPQTTRRKILGIATKENYQAVYVDTPGMHKVMPHVLNKWMNRVAVAAARTVDVILFVSDGTTWTDEDEYVLESLKKIEMPVIWIINKIDQIKDKERLIPHIAKISERHKFAAVLPLSARRPKDVKRVSELIKTYLPEVPEFLYPVEQMTDQSESLMMSELIREILLTALGDEVPHLLSVAVEKVEKKPKITVIHAVIYVVRESHKAIVIGKQGSRLKAIGEQSRASLEAHLQTPVFLQLWVKVREGWVDDVKLMQQLGYSDD